jgi:hypothetical protein
VNVVWRVFIKSGRAKAETEEARREAWRRVLSVSCILKRMKGSSKRCKEYLEVFPEEV